MERTGGQVKRLVEKPLILHIRFTSENSMHFALGHVLITVELV